ncbi:unnamed protein product [Penicillium salamii]|uniref:Putative gamma-glutamylcyclotransferase n=1 Tax=Penicillium salamii TaxID=1612424 RepID=A0A9W4JQ39_9EURO|nr:unnamed protein product [Penicillium salamii]CAG8325750.1 unnamed protein product [Penicillium salamii]CAG8347646.1 unnamed protein product [Penicillium salamii]CAG8386368.1 unnamed protein product [Penicillium salamii]CAG8404269.1 unnamed protein product [Penicillium salamii]
MSNIMIRKFLEDDAIEYDAPITSHETDCDEYPREEYCFFYGTLQDLDRLSLVLGTANPPPMRRARVTGYEIKLWGPYPATADKKLSSVNGMVCGLLSPIQLDLLAAYETEEYKLRSCLIDILNDDDSVERTIEGVIFTWAGQPEELREGTFDLKQWKKDQELRELELEFA